MLQTIYIDRKFIKLSSERKQLILHTKEGQKTSLPFRLIERLIIHGHCLIDTYLLGKLAENNITTVLFSSIRAQQMAVINGLAHNDASIHINQYRFYQNTQLTLSAATQLVKAKLLRQYRFVKKIMAQQPTHRKICFNAQQQIKAQLEALDSVQDQQQLLGIEGYAARQYFAVFIQQFPDSLQFNGRNKRPPKDPVNAMLSLSYTIFAARCTQALTMVGLDPYIGFYHKISYARKSLALDMMEPWRPLIDQFVYQLFHDKVILNEFFSYKGEACLLNKSGRSLYYPAFEGQMKIWQKGINRMARYMVKELDKQIHNSTINSASEF